MKPRENLKQMKPLVTARPDQQNHQQQQLYCKELSAVVADKLFSSHASLTLIAVVTQPSVFFDDCCRVRWHLQSAVRLLEVIHVCV